MVYDEHGSRAEQRLPAAWNLRPIPPIAGIEVPLTEAGWGAAEICRLKSEPYLANHASRAYFWAAFLAEADGVTYDAERLWIAALLHDIGLVDDAPRDDCFECVGADLAAGFLTDQGWPPDAIADVADAIRLHMAVELPPDMSATARLLDAALSLDVSGRRYDEVPPPFRDAVLERLPRLNFKRRFARRLTEVAAERPACTTALFMSRGMADRIERAPWSD